MQNSIIKCLLVTFFSYASFVPIGYLKDIEADEATNYKTFPVVWGWKKTILLGDVFAMATLLLFWLQPKNNFYEATIGLMASFILYGQMKGHLAKEKNEKDALHS